MHKIIQITNTIPKQFKKLTKLLKGNTSHNITISDNIYINYYSYQFKNAINENIYLEPFAIKNNEEAIGIILQAQLDVEKINAKMTEGNLRHIAVFNTETGEFKNITKNNIIYTIQGET